MTRPPRSIGAHWEAFAARHAENAGLRILERQYHCRLGEIDLIALDGTTLVFIEVRYRTRSSFADAAASVTFHKQRRIIRTARHFLMRHPHFSEHAIRMDVIAVEACQDSAMPEPVVRWIRAAFDACDDA